MTAAVDASLLEERRDGVPVSGVLMAELIADGKTRDDLEQLRADRYHDLPGFQTRAEIKAKGRATCAGYYGGKRTDARR